MTITSNILYKYRNGNVDVTLYDDGTKVRSWIGHERIDHPESIDIKITNQCNAGCAFCHEKSVPAGAHGDIHQLSKKIEMLPKGIELALGGGNPMAHPDLSDFLLFTNSKGFVTNLTVNQVHIKQHVDKLDYLLYNNIIRGLGISINGNNYYSVDELMSQHYHIVFHVIAGVHDIGIIDKLKTRYNNPRILILGYKKWGFGEQFYDNSVKKKIHHWKVMIPLYLNNTRMAFDNLGIEQLEIKKWFTSEEWNKMYMGDDFSSSMYIDAVNGVYAPTSRSNERQKWDLDVVSYWRQEHGN